MVVRPRCPLYYGLRITRIGFKLGKLWANYWRLSKSDSQWQGRNYEIFNLVVGKFGETLNIELVGDELTFP